LPNMQGCEIRLTRLIFVIFGLQAAAAAWALSDEDFEPKKWEEAVFELPAAPRAENLQPFYVSAIADNKFYIDLSSINIANDEVVRFAVVVESPSGVRNVSFEGIRCDTREKRLYAMGRSDGSWSRARNSRWERIIDPGAANRYHAALFLEYFCPTGLVVRTADEARDALRKGGHPSLKRSD